MSAGTFSRTVPLSIIISLACSPQSQIFPLALHCWTSGSALSLLQLVMVVSLAEVTLFGCNKRKPTLEDMLNGH